MISVIVPCYNEENAVEDVVRRVRKAAPDAEIVVVDDGSSDRTYERAKGLGINLVKHDVNKGKAVALRTGYANAKGDTIVTIDADCTYPPEYIPDLIKKFNEGYDLVVGSRFKSGIPTGMPLPRSLANMTGSLLMSLITLRHVTDATSGFRIFKKELTGLKNNARNLEYEVEFTVRAIRAGYRYGEIAIKAETRVGKSKLKFFRDMWKFFATMLRARFF
jgi:glycosyltransferase involved in cell wall biosynthesis